MKHIIVLTFFLFCIMSCQPSQKGSELEERKNPTVSLVLVWQTDAVMQTPEAVRYNKEEEVIYVMNMGVKPNSEKDGDGTVSKLSTDGEILEKAWVTGLNSPKGAQFQNGSRI